MIFEDKGTRKEIANFILCGEVEQVKVKMYNGNLWVFDIEPKKRCKLCQIALEDNNERKVCDNCFTGKNKMYHCHTEYILAKHSPSTFGLLGELFY